MKKAKTLSGAKTKKEALEIAPLEFVKRRKGNIPYRSIVQYGLSISGQKGL